VRIASLVASATEIVAALGLERDLVGVSADSDWPPRVVNGVPVLNTVAFDPAGMSSREIDAAASTGHAGASLYHIEGALLRSLRPDLILTQEICEVCSVSRHDVERVADLLGYSPTILSLNAASLPDMLSDVECVAAAAGVPERGQAVVASLRGRLEQVRDHAYAPACRLRESPPRVGCLEWLDPLYSAGHWIPEMVALAGGRDVLGTDAGPSRQIDWQAVLDAAPEAIVLMPCSLSLERVAAEFADLRLRDGWADLPAVSTGRVFAGHTDLFARSGPRLVDGVETLARLLDPACFTDPLPEGAALKVTADGRHLAPYR
jgi:iron complex transport system substrate-binding protein